MGGGSAEFESQKHAMALLERGGEDLCRFRFVQGEAASLGMVCGGDVEVQFQYQIISTGYNGAPGAGPTAWIWGYCSREAMQVPRGERYELCRSVHAEANAIISASRRDMVGGTLYLVGGMAAPALCCRMPLPAPCAAVWSSTQAWKRSSSGGPKPSLTS